jgi:hypothetical protein
MEETKSPHRGWVGYGTGPHGKDHLAPDVRAEVERQEAARAERRGRLLCEVLVRVYEREAIPSVGFPAGAVLGVESPSHEVAAAVAQAREALGSWR